MDTTTNLSIAGLVFGVLSFIILCMYIIITTFVLPRYKGGLPPWGDMGLYACIFGLFLLLPLNFAFSSLAGAGTSTPNINRGFLITLTILLSILNIGIGYTAYLKIGKSMSGTLEYLEVGLPANLFVSIVAVAMIVMNALARA
jgi:uncharacterized membrane protein YidH (DUF202 family)